jgi:N-acetylglucosaminyldiphosphoundecaprenol N-acetyl-beta-D-mannosaminyltransferase
MPEIAEELLARTDLKQVMLVRWWDFMKIRANRELRVCARKAALVVPVSKSLAAGARFLTHARPERHLPFSLVIRLLGALEDRKKSIYILGGNPEMLRTVEQNLRETFPGLRCVGRYTGLFSAAVETDIITAISKAQPDLLLLGSGVPGSDRWIHRHRAALGSCIALSSPETFAIFAERRKRTSKSAFRRGTDFLPNLLRRPWRILRFPVFVWYVFLLLIFRVFRI